MSGFYVPFLPEQGTVALEGEEFHHAIRTLRHRVGDSVWLTDGKGHLAEGVIQKVGKTQAEVEIRQCLHRPGEPPVPIAVLMSPLKQLPRIEWLVEKAVELGATAVYFLCMERTVRPTVPLERLRRIAIAALKQNLRSVLPDLVALPTWEAFPWERFTVKCMGEIGATRSLREALSATPQPFVWVIGPEGDFAPEELSYLKQKECNGVHLGNLRLRAETAAIVGLSALKVAWGY